MSDFNLGRADRRTAATHPVERKIRVKKLARWIAIAFSLAVLSPALAMAQQFPTGGRQGTRPDNLALGRLGTVLAGGSATGGDASPAGDLGFCQ